MLQSPDYKTQNLEESPELFKMLTDCSIDRVMAIDLSWNIVAWNKTSENISGIGKQDILGKNLLEVFPQIKEDSEMMKAIHSAFEGKKSFLPSDHGLFNRFYYENHFIPLKDEGKSV